MATNCSATKTTGYGVFCGSFELWMLLTLVSTVLVLSLCWNILCCIGKYCTDKGKLFLPRFRRSLSLRLRDMEDNPIYGNISYTQTRVDLPLSPPAASDRQDKSTLQAPSSGQDCYANLKLKVPKPPSGRSSPVTQIQYSDVMTLPRTPELDKNASNTDTASLHSDLYASVDTERNKTKTPDSDEAYANHV